MYMFLRVVFLYEFNGNGFIIGMTIVTYMARLANTQMLYLFERGFLI